MFIFANFALPHAILRVDLAGRDFSVRGYFSRLPPRGRSGRDVQAKLCYSSLDCDTELFSNVLSDGDIITVVMNVSVARVFFKTSDIGKEPSDAYKFVCSALFTTLELRLFKPWLVRLARNRIVQ